MKSSSRKGLVIAYNVVGPLVGLMMLLSASAKLTQNPQVVKVIHGVVGVPLGLFPVLGALLVAGGVGLIAGIFRPKVGLAAGAGLVVYFLGAVAAHALAGDWAGMASPVLPLVLAAIALTLRWLSIRQAA